MVSGREKCKRNPGLGLKMDLQFYMCSLHGFFYSCYVTSK